jgi:branched-chain amino acid transport system substrate-binding protein
MTKIFFTLGVFSCAFVLPSSFAAKGEIKVGFLVAQTGMQMNEGKLITKALDLAVKQINAAGGIKGKMVKVIPADTKSDPKATVEAYNQLIDQEKVFAVIGTQQSSQMELLIPKMLSAKVPTFIGAQNANLTKDGQWFFRTRAANTTTTGAIIRYIKEDAKLNKVAIINDNGAFGAAGGDLLEKQAKDAGLTLVKRVGFKSGEKSFSGPMKELKDSKPEALIAYIANYDDAGSIEKEYGSIGKPFMYIGSPTSQSSPALAAAGEAANGIFAIADFVFGESAASKKYEEDYRKEYNETPDAISAYAYDSMIILAKAIKTKGENTEKVREFVMGLKGYKGVEGDYAFAPQGDGIKAVSLVQIENGKPKFVKKLSASIQ